MNILTNTQYAASPALYEEKAVSNAKPLTEADRQAVLDFLSRRPVDSVILAGWIHDHGIISPQHRGVFYGSRDANGDLNGVAMIGRNLLFEAATDEAIEAFAKCARNCPDVRMVFAEEEKLRTFWSHYQGDAPMPKISRHRQIISTGEIADDVEGVELRVATRDELEQVVAAQAEMVLAETGVDPLEADAEGFRMRCLQRVDRGRVWVWMKDGELIFKTDIMTVTPETTYIEGLWVNPKERGKRYSTRGMASLCEKLRSGSNVVSGFVDAEHSLFRSLYRKAGFVEGLEYAKIFV
jgi:hypothetical protein